jgi:hypothetical protein
VEPLELAVIARVMAKLTLEAMGYGYRAGYMGVHPIAEDFWAGYKVGTEQVVWDKESCKYNSMPDQDKLYNKACKNISHYEGPPVATSGPTKCDKSGCEASIGQVG